MHYDNRNIVLNELIGLKVRIIKSTDSKQKGLNGSVIDETKNTLLLETSKGVKRVIKKSSTLRFYYGGKSFVVEGREINFRPEERISKGLLFYKLRNK